jgi:uncharacterized membrane protein
MLNFEIFWDENNMHKKPEDVAKHLLNKDWDALEDAEKRVIEQFIERKPISHSAVKHYAGKRTFGEIVADRVAAFGGSWTFIITFFVILFLWVFLNAVILVAKPFDAYPFIFLNLILSMLAAVQAPIIMMSQNRQAAKDRMEAEHDYEVNLRAELEIIGLHHKIDELREIKWIELIDIQQKQIALLEKIVSEKS